MTTGRTNDGHGCELAHDDAAYVLGSLSPAERLAFERHLDTCSECDAAVRQLAGLPGLLGRLTLDDVESAPAPEPVPVPATLLPRLVEEVRRVQRRRRWAVGLAAAAAVAAIAVLGATVVEITSEDEPPPAASGQTMTPIDQDRVDASVALTSVAWGTRLDLTCSYDEPSGDYSRDEPAPTYSLVVRTQDGGVEQVATWKALPGRTMHLTGATALDEDQIASVEVRTADGRPVLQLTG